MLVLFPVCHVQGSLHTDLGLLRVVDEDSVSFDTMLEDGHDGRLLGMDGHLGSLLVDFSLGTTLNPS